MSPALVFVVPAAVAIVLAIVTGLAYWHARRAYLAWWAGAWLVSLAYYLAVMASVLVGQGQADLFSQLGLLATALGWARGVGLLIGARVLADAPLNHRFWTLVGAVAAGCLFVVVATPFGQQSTATATRLTYAAWFVLAAVELLRASPRTRISAFCGAALLLLGIQGAVASQLTLDLTGSLTSGWISTALSTALGLGVLGRMLEEEREAARSRSQELAIANARLAELDKLKTEFVSMVSHELRTPLGLIKGYAGSLLRPDLELDEGTRREFLQVVEEETDRLTELVTNLLDMSRIEAGTLRVEPRPTDLARLLAECSARLRAREPTRAVDLEVVPSLPLVQVDDRRIMQVVDNLLTNAALYSPDGTPIVLRASLDGGQVTVMVEDQGPGIPLDHREHVFEKFIRLDGNGPRPAGGTGLGLAICRGIVQAHGGQIWVESNGGGSTFAFRLPATVEAS